MEYRKMGNTGLKLSVLSFGSWVTFSRQVGDSSSDTLMNVAYEHGINFFDNAEGYEGGRSEELMGRTLRRTSWRRTSYCISSKVFFGLYGKQNKPTEQGLSRKHIMDACHQALQRLQTDYLDLFFCHRPDPDTPIEEVVWTMNILIQQGKILYWGTSEWSAVEIMEAHRIARDLRLIPPAVEQPQYNLFERHKMEQDYVDIFRTVGMGTTIWSPLASGLLTGKYNDGVPADSRLSLEEYGWLKERALREDKLNKVRHLADVAHDLGVSLATLSVAWCIRNPHVSTAILGATKESQLLENLHAVEVYPRLTADVMQRINEIMA